MNNKMAINTYQQLNLKNKLKQTRTDRVKDTENVLIVVRQEGCGRMGEAVKGLRSTNR